MSMSLLILTRLVLIVRWPKLQISFWSCILVSGDILLHQPFLTRYYLKVHNIFIILNFWLRWFFNMISKVSVIKNHEFEFNHFSFKVKYSLLVMRRVSATSTLLAQKGFWLRWFIEILYWQLGGFSIVRGV